MQALILVKKEYRGYMLRGFKSTLFFVFLGLFVIATNYKGYAQTGSLGDPVVHITFGAGTSVHAGALPADSGVTSYTYSPNDFPFDGYYTIENTTAGAGQVWWSTTDHTGNPGGYMMIVNADVVKTDYFYEREVDGLCSGTTYQFSAWLGNLLRTEDLSPPNVIFGIYNESDGTLIGADTTGLVKLQPTGFKWVQYKFNFTLPAGTGNVIIKMTNNANGGAPANDLALDDITFSPYGPSLVASFSGESSTTKETECAGETKSFTLTVAPPTGYTDPAYQWQVNNGSGWVDIVGATTLSYTASPTGAGTYEYRLATAEGSSISSLSCRVVSNVLTLSVNSPSAAMATATSAVCAGGTLSLTASSGDSYSWTGPNNFKSTAQNPTITNATTPATGTYTVRVTTGNCYSDATATANVYALPVANAGSAVTICSGDNTQLQSSGGTTYSWSPTTGLSDPTIANPIASPTDTTKYTVTVSNSICSDTASVMVNVLQKPVAHAGPDKVMVQGQTVTLNGKASGSNISYYWTPNEYLSSNTVLDPLASPPSDITYTLHVVSNSGCGAEADDEVNVKVYKSITIPNTFSPNGDGINDTWNIQALNSYPLSVTTIFNRYGSVLFKSTGYNTAWDGNYHGQPVPSGTYYYLIDLKNGTVYSGWLLVVR